MTPDTEPKPLPMPSGARFNAAYLLLIVPGIVVGVLFAKVAFPPKNDPVSILTEQGLQALKDKQKLSAPAPQTPTDQNQNPAATESDPNAGTEPPLGPINGQQKYVPDADKNTPTTILKGVLPSGGIPPGPFQPGGMAPINPIVIKDPEAQPPSPEVAFSEIVVIVSEIDVDPTSAEIASLAKANGGTVQDASEADPPGHNLILSVPNDKAKAVQEGILKLGSAQVIDDWKGPFSERRNRMERFLKNQISEQDKNFRALSAKFLDDAPQVVRAKEQLDALRAQLASLRSVPENRTAIRVYVGKKAP